MEPIEQELNIGTVLRNARLDAGYTTRVEFVETAPLKGKLTDEGLRKIEEGERVPRCENIRRIARAAGLSDEMTRRLEQLALTKSVERVTRRGAGNASVTVHIEGTPVKVAALPPRKEVETFLRAAVNETVELAKRYGTLQDEAAFRRRARANLYKLLNP